MLTGNSTRALIASLAIGWSTPAGASAPELCGDPSLAIALRTYPSDAALLEAAERIEDQVRGSRATGVVIAESNDLTAVGFADDSRPAPAALARYCFAAGELSLVSENGSQQQARSYLFAALEYSRRAALPALTGRIAYRLGLNSTGGMPLRTVRGAGTGGVRRAQANLASQLRNAASTSNGTVSSCAMLSTAGEGSDTRGVGLLALDCAAQVASGAEDHITAAIADVRFAKGALELARSFEEPESLRALARIRIFHGFHSAGRISDPAQKADLLARLAGLAIDLALDRSAITGAIGSIAEASRGDPVAMASIAELRGRLALKAGQRDIARDLFETAIFEESRRELPYRLPAFYILLSEADPQRRAEHVAVAYAALQNLRPKIPRFDPLTEESMFSMHMRSVFEAAAAVQLEAATDDTQLLSAQRIIEDFRQAELQNALGSECLPQRAPLQASDLGPGEALLYPLVFKDRLELIFVSGDTKNTRFVRLPPHRGVSGDHITALAERLSVELNSGNNASWREPARELYDLLIKPIEASLSPGGSLAIIPDRALRGVPFATLLGPDGKYLIEKTAISVAPALAYSQPGVRSPADSASIVAASLQREVNVAGITFPALAGTASEAEEAANHGNPGRWLADFTRDQLATALAAGSVDVLHLATHASFNGRSDKAYIVARDGVIPLAELREMISRNSVRDGLLDLLVLSACETAVGDDESSMGLAGAAIGAGSVSAIASLWPVDDVGSSELMRQFYRNYQGGRSRAQALREAQVSLLSSGGDNSDPFVWAAFTLVGAWR